MKSLKELKYFQEVSQKWLKADKVQDQTRKFIFLREFVHLICNLKPSKETYPGGDFGIKTLFSTKDFFNLLFFFLRKKSQNIQ